MTMTEPTLFGDNASGPGPGSRTDDPETSKVAYLQLKVRERQSQVLRAMRHRIVSSTAEEIRSTLSAFGFRQERNEVASRLAEMADGERWPDQAPLVRRVGVKKNHRGRPVATWTLTAAGKRTAVELDR